MAPFDGAITVFLQQKECLMRMTIIAIMAIFTMSATPTFADDYTSPAESWEGLYLGANIGAGQGSLENLDIDGVIGGGQIGYRHAVDDRIVLGVEIAGRYSGMGGSQTENTCVPADCGYNVDQTLSVENTFGGEILVEAGVTAGDFLVSAVAGPAWRRYQETWYYDYTGATWDDASFVDTNHLLGVAFGGRLSYQAFENASLEVEYLQVQVQGNSWTSTSGASSFSGGMDADERILSLRFNYRR